MTLAELESAVRDLYDEMLEAESMIDQLCESVSEEYRQSARNLCNYLILRSADLRHIHDPLSDLGISSLRTGEGYVLGTVCKVLKLLCLLMNKEWEPGCDQALDYSMGKEILREHANHLFNGSRKKHFTEIMVTMPDEAAEDQTLLESLVQEGMDTARINLSHGDYDSWNRMITNLKAVGERLNKPIRIYMDLPGPKIRTGNINLKGKKKKAKKFLEVRENERLTLIKDDALAKEAVYDHEDKQVRSSYVGVQLPQVIDDIEVGDRVYFDDGTIEAIVESKAVDSVGLKILKAHKKRLKSEKGINLPDTDLNLASLTENDKELLPFISENADMVGYSFVRTADDVKDLYAELDNLGNRDIGVIYKIETRDAFANLPAILLEAMKRNKIGVMIARGDLAVEIGFERIAEVQNQILWLCEAAHVPVIWATQVLENLAKAGIATRAEVTDAALSTNAECVMLNKGPHIVAAVKSLKDILSRMQEHTSKRKSSLRALNVAKRNLELLRGSK